MIRYAVTHHCYDRIFKETNVDVLESGFNSREEAIPALKKWEKHYNNMFDIRIDSYEVQSNKYHVAYKIHDIHTRTVDVPLDMELNEETFRKILGFEHCPILAWSEIKKLEYIPAFDCYKNGKLQQHEYYKSNSNYDYNNYDDCIDLL